MIHDSVRKGLVLLIDDSASVRGVLRLALESEGYRVVEAADGRGADIDLIGTELIEKLFLGLKSQTRGAPLIRPVRP